MRDARMWTTATGAHERTLGEQPPAAFGLQVWTEGDAVTAQVAGPLDAAHAPELLGRLRSCLRPRARLVVDLTRAEYVDSTGVRALLALKADLEAEQGSVRVVARSGSRALRTLELLRLLEPLLVEINGTSRERAA